MSSRQLEFPTKFYLPLLVLLCCVFAWQPLRGVDDFWAHASIGRWIAQHGHVPDQTLFLWGPGTPIKWVYHSWLSQLTFYEVLINGGPFWVEVLTCVVAAAICIWMWQVWACRGRITSLMPLLFAIALWCSSPRLHPRPELFSGLFLCPLLTFLLTWTEARRDGEFQPGLKWKIPALFAMFALWANFHGGVATGILFIGLTVLGEAIQDVLERRIFKPTLWLAGLIPLCAAAVCINPYGPKYWTALRSVGGVMFSYIDEWKALWLPPFLPPEAIMIAGMLAFVALAAWLQEPRHRVAHLLWLLFSIVAFATARRHLWQMAQVSVFVMAANAAVLDTEHFWRVWRGAGQKTGTDQRGVIPLPMRAIVRYGALLGLTFWVLGAAPKDFLALRPLSPSLPAPAAEFIRRHYPKARLLSDYSTTSYLQWHLSGHPPLYMDLLNAYDDQLMIDYFAIIYLEPRGLKLIDDLKIDLIFLKSHKADERIAKFALWMKKNPRWQAVYRGQDATIWARRQKPS